jgi:hypothetical protein
METVVSSAPIRQRCINGYFCKVLNYNVFCPYQMMQRIEIAKLFFDVYGKRVLDGLHANAGSSSYLECSECCKCRSRHLLPEGALMAPINEAEGLF